MSLLRTLYTNLAAVTFTYGGQAVQAFDLDELPQAVDSARLPCRLLLPFGALPNQGNSATPETFGLASASDATWLLNDLLLGATYASGAGIASHAPNLVDYVTAYVEALIHAQRYLGTNGAAEVRRVQPRIDVFNWPLDTDQKYFGVLSIVTVAELL